ncbi:MAG: divalent cation tolerance protein CutA, partial [Desulfobacterales bacterium]
MTAGNKDEARNIGKALVSSKLAACVNILDNMNSFYMWDGELQDDNEVVMIAK